VPRAGQVLDAFGTEWVGCFVRCTTGGAFHRWVGTGVTGATSGDRTEVVLCIMLLGADGAGGFFRFAQFGVVAISLTVMAVGVGGL
jgi:hypothetical protein